MFDCAMIRTEIGKDAKYINGTSEGGRREIGTAKTLLESVGNSRFSVVAFGSYLFASVDTDEEMEKMTLASIYFLREVSGLDTPVGFMAQRVMDSLNHYGYVDEDPNETVLD